MRPPRSATLAITAMTGVVMVATSFAWGDVLPLWLELVGRAVYCFWWAVRWGALLALQPGAIRSNHKKRAHTQ